MRINHLLYPLLTGISLATIMACSDDSGLEKYQQQELSNWTGESIDPNHTWITSTPVYLNVTGQPGCTVTAQTILNEKVTILGQQTLKSSHEVMSIDVPQGIGESFGIVYNDGTPCRQYRRVDLSGEEPQVVNTDFSTTASTRAIASSLATTDTSALAAEPSSVTTHWDYYGYMNYGSWAWKSVGESLVETKPSDQNDNVLIDYELIADADKDDEGNALPYCTIYISYLYGYTGTTQSRVLGFYTHNPNNYEDATFYDLGETLKTTKVNGQTMVQYQLDGNSSTWLEANFKNLNAESTKLLSDNYDKRISAVRGYTFKITMPAGIYFGFYLRNENSMPSDQKEAFTDLNIPDSNHPNYGATYSKIELNKNTIKRFRSAIAVYSNFTFMGLDDNISGGDLDCNDVTFALLNYRGDKLMPHFTPATIASSLNANTLTKHPEYIPSTPSSGEGEGEGSEGGEGGTEEESEANLQSWTIGYEDSGMNIDFDFNDVVLRVTPNTSKQTISAYLRAAGGMKKTLVYYDDPNNGKQLLGEVHELFGVKTNTTVNTGTNMTHNEVLLSNTLNWPSGSTMSNNRNRFYIEVYDSNDTLERTVHAGDTMPEDNTVPQTICVATGEWEWPQETTPLPTAYTYIGKWGRNHNDANYFNWYTQGDKNKVTKNK